MQYDQWKVIEPFKRDFLVKRDPAEQDDLPMIPLKGRRGSVYVHGAQTLGAVYRCGQVSNSAAKLRDEFPGVDVHEADGELLATWPTDAPWSVEVMDWLGARRRKRLSPQERERSRQLGLKYRHNLSSKRGETDARIARSKNFGP